MTPYIDLHVHSTESDGTFTPAELVDYAVEKKLAAFALTDHDTTAGIDAVLKAAEGRPVRVIPGIEFSCLCHGRDIHILGLLIDYRKEEFQREVIALQRSRELRNEKMIQKLQGGGFSVTWADMEKRFGRTIWTRANFAVYLTEKGYCADTNEAFDLYLGNHAPYYLPRKEVHPDHIFRLIQKAGGISVLAHPFLYRFEQPLLESVILELKELGLQGLEAIYSLHTPDQEHILRDLAAREGLLISGGSDFHGMTKPSIDLGNGKGNLTIPLSVLENLEMARTSN